MNVSSRIRACQLSAFVSFVEVAIVKSGPRKHGMGSVKLKGTWNKVAREHDKRETIMSVGV